MAATTLDADPAQRAAPSAVSALSAPPAVPGTPAVPAPGRARRGWLTSLLSIAACGLLWHLASSQRWHLGLVDFRNVPGPLAVASAFAELLRSPRLLQHLASSLSRIAWGFGLAALLGIGLGLAIGRFGWARHALWPPLEVLRPIPAVAWIPLSVLMFPSSEGSMVFITFVGALFPILLATIHGVEGIDARLLAAARGLGCSGWRLFVDVVLPGAAPAIATGLAIGMGTCWFCLVSAEMISGQFGIGYWTWESYTVQNYANIVVGMLLIGVLGMGSSALLRRLAALAMPWYRTSGAAR